MKRRSKIIVLFAGLFLLLLHFTLVTLYANPFPGGNRKLSSLAFAYVYPFFHQNWNLFAPAPDSNYQLIAVYDQEGPQQKDLFGELIAGHQGNRLRGEEALVATFVNSIHYFEKNSPLQKGLNGPVKNDAYFDMLAYTAKNYLKNTDHIQDQEVRLILVVENIHTKARRIYFN